MFLEVRSLTTVQSPIILKLQLRRFLICTSRPLQVRIVYPQVISFSRTEVSHDNQAVTNKTFGIA